jgi:hypothetical protein
MKKKYLKEKLQQKHHFKKIASDIFGPIPNFNSNQNGKNYGITIIDIYSRWCVLELVHDIKVSTVTNVMIKRWLRVYPKPESICYDQGLQFISQEFKNIKHYYATIFNPRGNSVVERINNTLANSIRCNKDENLN